MDAIKMIGQHQVVDSVGDGVFFGQGAFQVAVNAKWISLGDDRFLVSVDRERFGGQRNTFGYYYLGIDGNPFVVEIDSWAFRTGRLSGPDALYAYLKPQEIERYEAETGDALRQGQLWAVRIPQWLVNGILEGIRLSVGLQCNYSFEKDARLFSTRHSLKGHLLEGPPFERWTLARGIITHENHSPLVLESLHLVMLSRGLVRYKHY